MFNNKKIINMMLILMLILTFCMSCSKRIPVTHPVPDKKCAPGMVWIPAHYAPSGIWVPGHCASNY